MFIQTWNKYLPVIKILLKRSVNSEQTLDMDKSDFERAAGGKKVKFAFSVMLTNGRAPGAAKIPQVTKDLIAVLQQDEASYKFLRKSEFEFTMNSNFQLLIKNLAPVTEPGTDDTTEIKPGESLTD